MRPSGCTYPECNRCTLDDCEYDELETQDILEQIALDNEIVGPKVLVRRERQKRYNATDKGKERFLRYNETEKGKERFRRYYQRKKLRMMNC